MFASGRLCVTALLGLALASGICADEPTTQTEETEMSWEQRIEEARTRRSEHWIDLVERFHADNPTREHGGIIFLGDSITEGFPIDVAFPDGGVINRGIGGDVVDGLRERLDISLGDLEPRCLYVMIGTNNIWWAGPQENATLFERYGELFNDLHAMAPDADIVIQSVLPAGEAQEALNPRVVEVNEGLRQMAEEHGFSYLDVHSIMVDSEGKLRSDYTVDGIHLTTAGYEAWIEYLFPVDVAIDAVLNLNAARAWLRSPSHTVDKTDPAQTGEFAGNRGRNEMVVYTPDYEFDSTGTNQWGLEAIVEDGVVVDARTEGDATIPANGFVVSGHGTAAQWIALNLEPGVAVTVNSGVVERGAPAAEVPTLPERLAAARYRCIDVLNALPEAGESNAVRQQGLDLLGDIIQLRANQIPVTEAMIRVIDGRVSDLESAAGVRLAVVDDPVPLTPREFRGLWVATVSNIDWPSEPGLTTEQMQAELIAIMDRAAELRLNAIIFQIRTGCDALFDSPMEPWSYYLTGVEGQAPDPHFDPLEMAIEEAHARGLELHAWLNPFRARRGIYEHSADHISQTQPDLVYDYSEDFEWLDPGREEAQNLSYEVIMDVVRRYDVDAIHFDDYFYPYPIEGLPFPDEQTYADYQASGGEMSLLDWRRDNINRFLVRVREGIHELKPWVSFGISPFGVWKPGYPEVVTASNMYDGIACDSLRWMQEGWVDYTAPQLYWAIDSPGQPYEPLLDWWVSENTLDRHVWPGLAVSRISEGEHDERHWPASEIVNQIEIDREKPGSTGVILYHDRPLAENRDGIFDALRDEVYTEDALVPATTWLQADPPVAPEIAASQSAPGTMPTLHWSPRNDAEPARWVVHLLVDGEWRHHVMVASERNCPLPFGTQMAAVSAVNRLGEESERAIIQFDTD